VPGGYKIANRNSGLVLDVQGGPSAISNGAPIDQWSFWGGTNQIWGLSSPDVEGYVIIEAANSGLCLDVTNRSTAPGAPMQQWACTGGDNQKWLLVPVQ
jgi:hypothetical protein